MDKIRFALIGAGYIAHYHARGLKEQAGAEITAVCAVPVSGAREFAGEHGIPEAVEDALSLAGRKDIDAAVIATPNKFHVPYAKAFLENGKDVFIEKPLGMNPEEGRELARVSERTGKRVMVGHMWRFDEEVAGVKEMIDSGRLGRIVKTCGYGIHENWGPEGWFIEKDLAGGGALGDMGVHAIDTVRYLLGDPEPEQVYARIGTHYGTYDVDDTGVLVITWKGGTVSLIESGWWQPHAEGPEAATRLYGTKGFASLFPTFYKIREEDKTVVINPDIPHKSEHCDQSMYTRQMASFVDCIRKRTVPVPGLKEGQVVLDIVSAAYLSSETNRVIRLS